MEGCPSDISKLGDTAEGALTGIILAGNVLFVFVSVVVLGLAVYAAMRDYREDTHAWLLAVFGVRRGCLAWLAGLGSMSVLRAADMPDDKLQWDGNDIVGCP